MEIVFEKKHEKRFRESVHLSKRLQESVESVVPDTDEDIGRIVSVQSSVLLKSKDLSGRGVLVTGEARAWLLCICEGEERLTSMRVTKPFTAEFEIAELTGEEELQVTLGVAATDARLVNPRKLSVSFELSAELSCYTTESVAAAITPAACPGLHVLCTQEELLLPNAVCEKSFVFSEQFPFPEGKARPERLIGEQAEIRAEDCQLIGSKAVIKGRAEIRAAYLSAEGELVQESFTEAFSQIMDIGSETMDLCTVQPQLTGVYCELADSISGEKVLDAEIHVLLQLVSRSRAEIRTVTDVYSNLTPVSVQTETLRFESAEERRTLRASVSESVALPEDCADVLCVFPTLSRAAVEAEKLSATVSLDILYRGESGGLAAVRRTLTPACACSPGELRLLSAALTEAELRPAGKSMEARVTLEAQALSMKKSEIVSIQSVMLDEEQAFDSGSFPTLTMVRREGESLWELAKRYHSSVEAIEAFTLPDAQEAMLLIPKAL